VLSCTLVMYILAAVSFPRGGSLAILSSAYFLADASLASPGLLASAIRLSAPRALADDASFVQTDLRAIGESTLEVEERSFVGSSSYRTPILSNTSPAATEVLHVNREWLINTIVLVVLSAVALITAIGFWSGSRGWVFALLVASYLVLIPGLFSKDFSFNIAVNVDLEAIGMKPEVRQLIKVLVPDLPDRIQITQPRGLYGPIHESTRSFVGFLWQSNCRRGAVLIAIFAFVVPGLKLLLLGVGELWRNRKNPHLVTLSRSSILSVQLISKWAAPDMFAMILLYYLLRGLHHPPLLESLQVLDLGFTFYSVFSVFSVISTLAIKRPVLPESETETVEAEPLMLRLVGRHGMLYVTMSLFVGWLVFFIHGIRMPCLSLRLEQQTIVDQFHLSASVMQFVNPVLDQLHLEQLIRDDVSMWRCAIKLWGWFVHSGSLNLLLAIVMLVGFVLVATVLDMVSLVMAAYALRSTPGGKVAVGTPSTAMSASLVLKHLSFMDVLVVGVIIIAHAAAIYKEQGIVIGLSRGIWVLAISEAWHYAAFYAVRNASGAEE